MSARNHERPNEQEITWQQSALRERLSDSDEERRERFVEDVAQHVVAKFSWFLILNAGALLGAIATGIGAYYSLRSDDAAMRVQMDINTRRIDRMLDQDVADRQAVESLIRDMRNEIKIDINDLRREIREHNARTTR